MTGEDLKELIAFALVAEERSFTRAAARLTVSPSALSHALRALEQRVGVQLLARTTRSVAPTAAGSALLKDLTPALEQIEGSLQELRQQREKPSGRIRLLASRTAVPMVLLPQLASFTAQYPDITLEITTVSGPVDLVSGQYDAGIQLGEFIQKDMIAARVSKDQKFAIVAAPKYFAQHTQPKTPHDLSEQRCIGFPGYRWEFQRGKRKLSVAVTGPLLVDDPAMVIQAAIEGVGIGVAFEDQVQANLRDGTLVRVLEEWCPLFPGFFMFYPSRRNQPAALAALIQTLKLT